MKTVMMVICSLMMDVMNVNFHVKMVVNIAGRDIVYNVNRVGF